MYFDEDLVLDLRFNVLNEFVDKFVIAEATKDHSGKDKKLNFNIDNFPKFKDKIKYIVVEDLPMNLKYYKKDWDVNHLRDQHQRNALSKGYEDCDSKDLIMISDIDEIPNPEKIKEFKIENRYACFIQKNFQQKINLLNATEQNWMGTKIIQKKYLKSPQWLRNIKTSKPPFWKFYKPRQPQLIYNGGWHFSFLKEPKRIAEKIKGYSHQEYNKTEFTDEEKIKEKLRNKIDIFERDYEYKKIDLDDAFPKYILKNIEKYKNWII